MRQRHLDQVRAELEAVKGKLRTAEEEGTRMRALISHNNHQARAAEAACLGSRMYLKGHHLRYKDCAGEHPEDFSAR